MAVSRRFTITYDAPDHETHMDFVEAITAVVYDHPWCDRIDAAVASEPVIPSPEPLVEPTP